MNVLNFFITAIAFAISFQARPDNPKRQYRETRFKHPRDRYHPAATNLCDKFTYNEKQVPPARSTQTFICVMFYERACSCLLRTCIARPQKPHGRVAVLCGAVPKRTCFRKSIPRAVYGRAEMP